MIKQSIAGLVLLSYDISSWSGGRNFNRDTDLQLTAGMMPPRNIVSDGQLQLVKDTTLCPFNTMRKRVQRLASANGFRCGLGTIAMTEQLAIDTHQALPAIAAEWQQHVDAFINDLPNHYADRVAEAPSWGRLLDERKLDAADVRSRFSFKWVWFSAAHASSDANSPLNDGLASANEDMARNLLDSLAIQAKDALKGNVGRERTVSQASLRQVRALMHKLHEYVFLDPICAEIYDAWEGIIDALPRTGFATATETFMVKTMLHQFSDVDQLIRYAKTKMGDASLIQQLAPLAPSGPRITQPSLQFQMAVAA